MVHRMGEAAPLRRRCRASAEPGHVGAAGCREGSVSLAAAAARGQAGREALGGPGGACGKGGRAPRGVLQRLAARRCTAQTLHARMRARRPQRWDSDIRRRRKPAAAEAPGVPAYKAADPDQSRTGILPDSDGSAAGDPGRGGGVRVRGTRRGFAGKGVSQGQSVCRASGSAPGRHGASCIGVSFGATVGLLHRAPPPGCI